MCVVVFFFVSIPRNNRMCFNLNTIKTYFLYVLIRTCCLLCMRKIKRSACRMESRLNTRKPPVLSVKAIVIIYLHVIGRSVRMVTTKKTRISIDLLRL